MMSRDCGLILFDVVLSLQNFEVRGKCIGQDTPECRDWYKKVSVPSNINITNLSMKSVNQHYNLLLLFLIQRRF